MSRSSSSRRSRAATTATALVITAATSALLVSPVAAEPEPFSVHGVVTLTPTEPNDDELLAACPIDGEATFEDSWGWPRSGGRSHQGVDMIAERGTPVIAVGDGDAVFKQNRLGGNAVWLTAPNGDKFYYAHLDSFEGRSRTVEAGELIGYVGSTGNAQGPHLHFETLPGGGVENPYGHTLAACVPTQDEIDDAADGAADDGIDISDLPVV